MTDYLSREALLHVYDLSHEGPPGRFRKVLAKAPGADVVPWAWLVQHAGNALWDWCGEQFTPADAFRVLLELKDEYVRERELEKMEEGRSDENAPQT